MDRRSLECDGRQNSLKMWFCPSFSKIGILTGPPTQGGRTKGMSVRVHVRLRTEKVGIVV